MPLHSPNCQGDSSGFGLVTDSRYRTEQKCRAAASPWKYNASRQSWREDLRKQQWNEVKRERENMDSAFVIGMDGKIAWIGHPMDNMDAVLERTLAAPSAAQGS